MKKIVIASLVALGLFSGCASVSTPALYTQNVKTHRWYNIYEANTCMQNTVKNYSTGALQCYSNGRKTHVIYPVTQAQRNIDSQRAMAQLQSMSTPLDQLNEMNRIQAMNNIAMSNIGRPVYNIYGY